MIRHPIRWAGRFFVGRSFSWDWDWDIGSAVVIFLSRTPLKFSRPIRLRLSSRVSSAIPICRTFHLACMIPLSSSNCVYPVVLIRCCLHHPPYLSLPSLLFYIYAASLMLLFPLSRAPVAVALRSCNPALYPLPVNTEQHNQGYCAKSYGWSSVCFPIGETPLPFRSSDSPSSYQAAYVPVSGAQYTRNRVRSCSGTPHFSLGACPSP